MQQRLEIAVVGCGSAGPAAAVLLQRAGHRVQIFERAPELLPVGAGFMLQPTGLAVLDQMGILPEVLRYGAAVGALQAITTRGRHVLDLRYDDLKQGLTGVGIHRAALLHAMVEAVNANQVPLHLGCAINSIEQESNGDVDRSFLVDSSAVRHGPFDLIIAADGARSVLRERYGPPFVAENYRWGALWFIGEDPDDALAGTLLQRLEGCRRMVGFLPTGRGVDSDTPLVSLFWSLQVDSYDQLRARGLQSWKQELSRIAPRAALLLDQIRDFDQLTLARYVDVRMRPWHRRTVLFIGDAAHATSPQLGQGVNLALVDASVLAECLERADDVPSALSAYADARRRHLAFYQRASRWLTPFFQSRSRLLSLIRAAAFPMVHYIPPIRRQMIRTMVGVKRGLVRRSLPVPELPDSRPLAAGSPRQIAAGSGE